MSIKENPRRLVAQATGQGLDDLSMNQYTTEQGNGQSIYDLLPQGETNAVASKVLANMVGATSVRDLQHMVAAERKSGALILSTCKGGYYRPQDGAAGQAEIARFIQTLRARALNTLRAIKATRKALEGVEGQLDLDDLEVSE